MTERNNRPLKICLISYRSNPHCGGQGVYIRNLSHALAEAGHHVEVVAGPPNPLLNNSNVKLSMLKTLDLYNPEALFRIPNLKELYDPINVLEWLGVSTMGYPEPLTFGFRAFRFLRSRLNQFDIVHDNQSLSYGIAAINKRVPTIATIHHPITIDRKIALDSVTSPIKKIKHMRWYSFIGMQKKVTKKLSKIITVSESSRNDISREFNIHKNKIDVIPNGINIELFYPIPEIKRDPCKLIVTNSADTPLKGLYYLLQSIAIISAKRKISLTVIGTPKKKGGIVKLVQKLGIGNLITFTGRISNRQFVEEYAKASIAVVPSVYEGFGLPVGEAMACAIPVICTTGGALPEVAGNAAILVPPENPEAIADAVLRLLDNPEYATKLGQAGYQRVLNHFTWKKNAEKTVKVYKQTINDYSKL